VTAGRFSAPLIVALVIGALLRIAFIMATPLSGPSVAGHLSAFNDEAAHANFAWYILQTHSLPGYSEPITAPGALERGEFEFYQSPLYYLGLAGLGALFQAQTISDLVMMGRMANALLAILLFVMLTGIARLLEAERRQIEPALIFVALSGVFVRFTATAGNDPLFWLVAAALTAVTLRMRRDGVRVRCLFVFTAVLALGLYVKLTALALAPLVLFGFPRLSLRAIGSALAVWTAAAFMTLPLWLHNLGTFGSLLPLAAGFGTPIWRVPGPMSLLYAVRSFIFPWSEFWRGGLGALLMAPFAILYIFALLRGGAARLVRQPVLMGALALVAASFLYLNLRYDQAEARYLFAAWPALALPLAGGVFATFRARWGLLAALLCPFLLLLFPFPGF
jgi:hypothetical protein